MDKDLRLSDMRKFQFSPQKNKQANHPKAKEGPLAELQTLMSLRKTSTHFKEAAKKKMN